MSWTDQKPEATDVLLTGKVFFEPRDEYVYFEIDRVDVWENGVRMSLTYRATVGNLFGSEEAYRDNSLEGCLRGFMQVMTTGRRVAA